MRVRAIGTEVVTAGAMSITELVDAYVDDLSEEAVVAVTSKVVSLCENRVVDSSEVEKLALIEEESERYVTTTNQYGFRFTVTHDTLIPTAGIDESNVGGGYLLWPADPQRTANRLRAHLARRFGTRHLGVIVTDSTCTPLRRGTSGICLAHSGFRAVNDYVGKPDLFGRPFHVSQANVAGGLAAASVLVMGEGSERTPLCVIEDVPFVHFQARNPSEAELREIRISLEDDLFGPFLSALSWKTGGRSGADAG